MAAWPADSSSLLVQYPPRSAFAWWKPWMTYKIILVLRSSDGTVVEAGCQQNMDVSWVIRWRTASFVYKVWKVVSFKSPVRMVYNTCWWCFGGVGVILAGWKFALLATEQLKRFMPDARHEVLWVQTPGGHHNTDVVSVARRKYNDDGRVASI